MGKQKCLFMVNQWLTNWIFVPIAIDLKPRYCDRGQHSGNVFWYWWQLLKIWDTQIMTWRVGDWHSQSDLDSFRNSCVDFQINIGISINRGERDFFWNLVNCNRNRTDKHISPLFVWGVGRLCGIGIVLFIHYSNNTILCSISIHLA